MQDNGRYIPTYLPTVPTLFLGNRHWCVPIFRYPVPTFHRIKYGDACFSNLESYFWKSRDVRMPSRINFRSHSLFTWKSYVPKSPSDIHSAFLVFLCLFFQTVIFLSSKSHHTFQQDIKTGNRWYLLINGTVPLVLTAFPDMKMWHQLRIKPPGIIFLRVR